jgi:hypothetical protein
MENRGNRMEQQKVEIILLLSGMPTGSRSLLVVM